MKSLLAISVLAFCLPLAAAADDTRHYAAVLSGNNEVPAISTRGSGTFHAYAASDGLHYELKYSGLEGGAPTAAHIHLGQHHTNGGVIAFLCSNTATTGIPACPTPPARVIGLLTNATVVGPAGQGISPGEFAALIKALNNGTAYVNVHSTQFPSGEIRGSVVIRVP